MGYLFFSKSYDSLILHESAWPNNESIKHGFLQSNELACLNDASSTTGTSNVTLEAKMIIVKGLIDANSACVCIMATCHT